MLNHFRTLLMNLPYAGDAAEHIDSVFGGVALASPFKEVYTALFPPGSSRFYKQFLAHSYLNIVHAAGLEDKLGLLDPRISYSLDYTDYFKIHRTSNPVVSNNHHPVFVIGKFRGNETNTSFYDQFLITQIANTDTIRVYSKVRKVYVKDGNTYTKANNDNIIQLTFDGSLSEPVVIGSTGISFQLGGAATFTNSSDKTWEFLVESPFEFDFQTRLNALKSLSMAKLFSLKSIIDTTSFENLWNQHYNPVYQIAGLLLTYVIKLDATL